MLVPDQGSPDDGPTRHVSRAENKQQRVASTKPADDFSRLETTILYLDRKRQEETVERENLRDRKIGQLAAQLVGNVVHKDNTVAFVYINPVDGEALRLRPLLNGNRLLAESRRPSQAVSHKRIRRVPTPGGSALHTENSPVPTQAGLRGR